MKRASSPRHRPLWRCPKCGKYFVTRNLWHACARHSLDEHFARRNPKLRLLFDALVGLLKRNGPLRVNPDKTRIALQVRMRFGGVHVRRDLLDLSFLLPYRRDHPRINRVVAFAPNAIDHHLEIRSPADLDPELASWLREAYAIGAQRRLLAGIKSAPPARGDFSWSEPSLSRPVRAALPDHSAPTPTHRKTARSSPRDTPPWACPKCGRRFRTRNQMHICSQLTLADALRRASPRAQALFRKLLAIVRRFGPVQIVPQKTRIALHAGKVFLGVRLLRDSLDCEVCLPRRLEHPRFAKILSVSPRAHYHYLRLSSSSDFNRHLRSFLHESFLSSSLL